ncbi:hypothetical protein CHS0354_038978 [Potamilus streckersoni]|uniref:Uncharacterized protein n=1 Tax=Potamilus streckersoni TaxID=2493646 RepID=A0AAE0S181_9BIVA|nr:hypothetical protein CHS0354_038978 [Potamilus streckersoni]
MRRATNPNDLLCPHCLDIFSTPRYLPCRHTFCEKCLDDFIQKTVSVHNKEASFNCPVCGKITRSPLPAIPIDKWASHFPDDRILSATFPDVKTQVEPFCNPCRMLGNTLDCTTLCTTCEKTLCLKCRKAHENHYLIETSDNTHNSNTTVGLTLGSSCPVHTNRDIEFICMSHDSMCCSDCVIDNHRRCTTLRIKDHIEELIQLKTSNDTTDHMKKLMEHLDCYTDDNRKAMKGVEMQAKGMVSEIDMLISMLQETRSRISKESQDLLEIVTTNRLEDQRQCKSLKAALQNSLKILEIVEDCEDKNQKLITMYQIKEQLLHYDRDIQVKFSDVKYLDIKLKLDDSFLALRQLNTSQFAKIEAVETTRKLELPFREETSTYVRSKSADRSCPRSSSHSLSTFQTIVSFFSFHKKVNAASKKNHGANETIFVKMSTGEKLKQSSGTKPSIKALEHATSIKATPGLKLSGIHDISDGNEHRYWGVLVLPSNRVLLIDRSHNQCRIFDSYIGNHLTDFDLKSEPFGACVLNENQPQAVQVAVAVWNGEIQILSLCSNVQDTNTRRMKTIKTKLEWCHSVATWTSDKLVVSGEYNSMLCWCIVSTVDKATEKVHTICEYRSDEIYPSFLTVSYDKSRVYISVSGCDNVTKGVVYCYKVLDGVCIFKYQNKELSTPRGITEDQQGNLCVLNERPAGIHLVSGNGALIQVLRTRSLRCPVSIVFKDMELYVTNDRRSEVVRLSLSY